ncbi:MAG: L-glutamate gamma-semialdehyde dehydrogenase [Alphaproteobacteria bacterium]
MAFQLRPSDYSLELLTLQRAISAKAFMNETDAVARLVPELSFLEVLEPRIYESTKLLIAAIRESQHKQGIESFLQEYGLDSEEGIAIMCLAEALLRIPDATTADRLIQSTFEEAQWEKHLGQSSSWLVNASSWGLLLTGKFVQFSQGEGSPVPTLSRLAGKLGEPIIREALKTAMRHIGSQFVLGETIDAALKNSADFEMQGFCFSYDMLGEGARSNAQAEHYLNAYLEAITNIAEHVKKHPDIPPPSLSVKLSGLHPRYQLAQHKRVMDELLPRLKQIALLAMMHNVPISIDAEESSRSDINLLVFTKLFADPDFSKWDGIGFVLQAYQKRAYDMVAYLHTLARTCKKRMPIRLVKGAYWDSEIKIAQLSGLPDYPVFTRKEHTDISYLACAGKILAATECFYPQFATHNARTVSAIITMARHYGVTPDAFEFQRLHGMGEDLYRQVITDYRCRMYAPVGEHKDLLAYLIRRLLENGANTSFVHLLMDDATPVETLLQDPIEKARAAEFSANPLIQAPAELYGSERKNSQGIDFGNLAMCEGIAAAITQKEYIIPQNTPLSNIDTMVQDAQAGFVTWSSKSLEERAEILERMADLLAAESSDIISLLIHEAKKTIPDAVAEMREAVDFCRYYAAQARATLRPETLHGATGESNILSLQPRGTFICISPWNFPLAIFMGQIAAALVTGNSVIAKPAEQTPRIAQRVVGILHQAGVPAHVLQLVFGDGTIGAALVKHPAISGVCFTGSMETAQHINRALAARAGSIIPFIAETGGQNCMVVDSSALLEAAVDDIMLSAFGSAGQRCSALRVLYVQADIADALIPLLKGAMQELCVGNPALFATDIGPVIDAEARDNLLGHIARMKKEATLIATARAPEYMDENIVLPHAFEISSITQLQKEIFGPVLHFIRFKAEDLEGVANAINSTGYGLTFGIHSRIESNIAFFSTRIRAGNIYVNRSMIGATVGVQPFGGEGLSGTGPKAGGPHYMLRFVTERTISRNTAAIGGNVGLLSDN